MTRTAQPAAACPATPQMIVVSLPSAHIARARAFHGGLGFAFDDERSMKAWGMAA